MTSPGILAYCVYEWYIVYIKPLYEIHTVLDDLDPYDKCRNKFEQNMLDQFFKKGFSRT